MCKNAYAHRCTSPHKGLSSCVEAFDAEVEAFDGSVGGFDGSVSDLDAKRQSIV